MSTRSTLLPPDARVVLPALHSNAALLVALLAALLLGPSPSLAQNPFDQLRRSAEQELKRQAERAEQDAKRKAEQELRRKAEEALRSPPRSAPTPAAQPSPQPYTAPTGAAPTPAAAAWSGAGNGAPLPGTLRTAPTVAWASDRGFRDWGGALLAGDLVIAASSSGKGGLYAIDVRTGAQRWKVAVANTSAAVPITDGRLVIVAWERQPLLAAYELATGKLAWSKPIAARQPALANGMVFVQHEDGFLHVLDVATGEERGKVPYARQRNWCAAPGPVIADGVLYLSSGLQPPANAYTDFFLHAFDLTTGRELWRYVPLSLYPNNYGACLAEILVVGDTVLAVGDEYLYGVDRATGRELYRQDVIDGDRRAKLRGLVALGGYVYGVTEGSFRAIDPATGQTLWMMPGAYTPNSNAAADGVVYFQGRVQGVHDGAPAVPGILNAYDVNAARLLWSFTHPTREPWGFDRPVVADGVLYVSTYRAMLKLQ